MKNLLTLLSFCFAALSAKSQTSVGGPLFSNSTWTLAGSPYTLNSDVQVANGVTLTIEPGVQVNFNAAYEILVKGTIKVLGTSSSKITFTGNSQGKAMIMFKSANLSLSTIRYAVFNGPATAVQLADETEHNQDMLKNSGTLLLSHVSINNSFLHAKGYFNFNPGLLKVDSSEFYNTHVKGYYPRSEYIQLNHCNITGGQIEPDAYNYGVTLNSCKVKGTTFAIGCCGANLTINKSDLLNCKIIDGMGSVPNGPLTINESYLTNTNLMMSFVELRMSGTTVEFKKAGSFIIGKGLIQCSYFKGTGVETAIDLKASSGYSQTGRLILRNTTFDNYATGMLIAANASNQPRYDSSEVDSCNFINISGYAIKNYSRGIVRCNNVWWGTTNASAIAAKVFDYYDDINYGEVVRVNNRTAFRTQEACPLRGSVLSVTDEQHSSLKIYPNPASGTVKLELPASLSNSNTLKIYNSFGQLIETIIDFNADQSLNVSAYAKGVYFVVIETDSKRYSAKLLVN